MEALYETITSCIQTTEIAFSKALCLVVQNAIVFFHWPFFSSSMATAAIVTIVAIVYRPYRRWRGGWLTGQIDARLKEIRRGQATSSWKEYLKRLPKLRHLPTYFKHLAFTSLHAITTYFSRDIRTILRNYYLPSFTSVVIAACILIILTVLPDIPQNISDIITPSTWLRHLANKLDKDISEGIEKAIEGLIVVIIALIVFAAESIRTGRSSDESRVLLRRSNLWVLTLSVTLLPLACLYPPGSGWDVVVVVAFALLTIYSFGRIFLILISRAAIASAERKFLRERVHAIVMESARQRIGNKILFEKLGADKEIKIGSALAKSWLPGGTSNFVFIDTSVGGTLADINLAELDNVASLIQHRVRELHPVDLPSDRTGVSGQSADSPKAQQKPLKAGAYLIRRFREEVTADDNIFARDNSVIAIEKSIAEMPGLIEDVRSRLPLIFKFSTEESPSQQFRDELQTTKDRLITALRNGALGEIDILRDTYLLVAEEFLIALNELGGGYSAEQARQERNNIFEGWNELRWLREDVRDLIVAAANTDNRDVVSRIIILPFAIVSRAFTADDQLLFQEFLSFSSFIYAEGRKHPDTTAGQYMMERAWSNVRDILRYYIEPGLDEGDSDAD